MLKKLLATLSTLSATILLTATVVSCGPVTFNKLMSRKIDPETFYGRLKSPIQNWSSGKTMQQSNSMHIANVVDGLLAYNEYDKIKGDLADGWKHNDDFTTWTVHIDDQAEWFKPNGDRFATPYKIKAHDVGNTMRYVFNLTSASEVSGLWQSLLQGADDLEKEINEVKKEWEENQSPDDSVEKANFLLSFLLDYTITKYIDGDLGTDPLASIDPDRLDEKGLQKLEELKTEREQFRLNNPDKMLLKIDDATNEVTFNMLNPSEFFDSVLTYIAFSPMPDEAVDWLNNGPSGHDGPQAINALNYGNDHRKILLSGAYYVEQSKKQGITFKANKNYRNQEDLHIKKIILHEDTRTSPSAELDGFESGDLIHADLKADDVGGWTKYVGRDLENPNFEGVHIYQAPSFSNWVLIYNYAQKTPRYQNPKDNPVNWAMSRLSTRALISYALNRQMYDKYWTRLVDPVGQEVSALSYNRYVPEKLVTFDNLANENASSGISGIDPTVTDYTQLVNDQYLMKVANPAAQAMNRELDGPGEVKKANLGGDLFYHNDYLAYMSLGYHDPSDSQEDEAKLKEYQDRFQASTTFEDKIEVLKDRVNDDFKAHNIDYSSDNPVTFKFLVTSAWTSNQLVPLKDMVNSFSLGHETNSKTKNPVHIEMEPTSTSDEYLQKTRTSKDYNIIMTGWSPDYTDPSSFLNTYTLGGDYEVYHNASSVVLGDESANDDKFNQLRTFFTEYTDGVDATKRETGFQRYNDYAQYETKLTYQGMMFNPIYIRELERRPVLSYQDLFSLTRSDVGTSKEKYFGRKLIPQLWTREEYQEHLDEYEKNREKVNQDIKNIYLDKPVN